MESALRKTGLIFASAAVVALFSAYAEGSARRATLRDTPTPSIRERAMADALKPRKDEFVRIGEIVEICDGKIAIVKMSSRTMFSDRITTYYACDETMTPTSILTPLGIAKKNCAAFAVVQGEIMRGDTVMAKYVDPKKERKAEDK